MNSSKIAIIGGGSFATALVKIFSNNTHVICWWLRNEDTVKFISDYHHRPNYLTDVNFDLTKIKDSKSFPAGQRLSVSCLLSQVFT